MQTVAGRYALEDQLGEGGMGQVYRARHLELGKVFALKVIAPAFVDDEVARERFNAEARLASEMAHPNLVSVVDFGEDPALGAYMVMELVEGTPLLEAFELPWSIKRAIDVLGQIADVLEHVHKRDVVHGDIKPDNILLVTEPDGPRRRQVVRLIDFGLASRHGGAAGEGVSGTPEYLAPERASGAPASVASDIYALGVLAFQLLSGTLPFGGSTVEVMMSHVYDAPPTVSKVRGEEVDPAIEALVARALAKDPQERHKSAAAFRYEINTIMDMLAMDRRQRGATIQMLFDHSAMPQAVVSGEGAIAVANRAFAQLIGDADGEVEGVDVSGTPLVEHVPGLLEAVRAVQRDGTPSELRAQVAAEPPFELVVWVSPLSSEAVHVLVRVAR